MFPFADSGAVYLDYCSSLNLATWNWSSTLNTIQYIPSSSNGNRVMPYCLTAFPLCNLNRIGWEEGCSLINPSMPVLQQCYSKDDIAIGELQILSTEAESIMNGATSMRVSLILKALLHSIFSLQVWTGVFL